MPSRARAEGKLSCTKIAGERVALIKAPSSSMAMYRLGDSLVMVAGLDMAGTKAIIEAVIRAN